MQLKFCPFCGGDELSHGFESPPTKGNVQCHSCDAFIVADTEDAAIAAWNRRAGLEAVRREERERCAKVADDQAALYRAYGAQRDRGAITCDRMFDHAATCADLANRIRALSANPQEGAAEVEGQGDGSVLRREKNAPPPRGGSVIGEDGNG